jgi:DNA-binding response OmpR family regulator
MEELLARVRAILRRRESFMPAVLEAGDIRLDPSDATLRCGGKSVELQNREYQLMEALMKNPGIFQSADSLVISAWGYDAEADANSVRVYLSGLRKKLAELGSHTEIVSRRNIGYALSWK